MQIISGNKYLELKEIAESLHLNGFNILGNSTDFSSVNELWYRAVHYNRVQNQELRDYESNEYHADLERPIWQTPLYSEKEGEIVNFAIKPYKYQFTRKEWFIILYCERNIATLQEIKRCLNFYRRQNNKPEL